MDTRVFFGLTHLGLRGGFGHEDFPSFGSFFLMKKRILSFFLRFFLLSPYNVCPSSLNLPQSVSLFYGIQNKACGQSRSQILETNRICSILQDAESSRTLFCLIASDITSGICSSFSSLSLRCLSPPPQTHTVSVCKEQSSPKQIVSVCKEQKH